MLGPRHDLRIRTSDPNDAQRTNHFVDVGACVGGYQIRNHRSAGVVSVPRKSRQEIELGELGCQRMIVEQP